ncbi:o-succinylbenzoate synthase [Gordonia terrae]|uniref:o-succinylbenzoate synthase n=2 Tax=Gordonia terrae TaxID=2055 RepID=A0AAD0KFP4_9ACTN|nr:O-succinylbenzoate synthase [Gordonia terrae]AWO85466.1 O-succinylbenzoate synthase [Gordonia terrae]GAB43732.1 o-succinylbenzoate synthase [Gordonia terrae NBRC 100016]
MMRDEQDWVLPDVEDVLASAVAVRLPMRTRFRGLTSRETMVFAGPAGWGEFGPFVEYDDPEAASWLRAGLEAAWVGPPVAVRDRIPVNATVPAIPAEEVAALLERYPGAGTAKVKVAEAGQTLDDDIARVAATRAVIGRVRVDANGGWTVDEAIAALRAIGDVEYAEQPCRTVEELAAVRRAVGVPIAADESIRKADDPYRVVAADAADVAVVKVAPLGGMRATLALAESIGLEIVVSSALDSAIGMAAGIAAAAALPRLELACGLGTGTLLAADVATSFQMIDGGVDVRWFDAEAPIDTGELALGPDGQHRWRERLRRCHRLLAGR